MEDQGVDGDIWNEQASVLLKSLNWEYIGDLNMDLPNEDKDKHGIDGLCSFKDYSKGGNDQAVIIEAKRYKTTSFTLGYLETWIKTLDMKLSKLRNSEDLLEKFPALQSMPFRTGIIFIWFHDFMEYHNNFQSKFKEALVNVKLTRKSHPSNKIYVFDNDIILKIASLQDTVSKINSELNGQSRLKFYYPSIGSNLARRSEILNINYMLGKFILADFQDSSRIENKVVFYFGPLNLNSFNRLKQALGLYSYLDSDKPLIIYTYLRDSEFRKIKPSVKELFDGQSLSIKEMETFFDLPAFIRDI